MAARLFVERQGHVVIRFPGYLTRSQSSCHHVAAGKGIAYNPTRNAISKQGSRSPLNLCRPDGRKSCAACCGLYHVTDGRRSPLLAKLQSRTDAFAAVVRDPDSIAEFATRVREREAITPLDPVIHVCEFVGFVDSSRRSPGCMLHPSAPGNRGIDLRGLCHYGSMACRGFFCPATEELEPYQTAILVELIDDWHLYGLVVTDVDYVRSVFRLVEWFMRNGGHPHAVSSEGPASCSTFLGTQDASPIDPDPGNPRPRKHGHTPCRCLGGEAPKSGMDSRLLLESPVREVLVEMFSWKASRPPGQESSIRCSRYHFKGTPEPDPSDRHAHVARLAECLAYSFQVPTIEESVEAMVASALRRLGSAPRR